MMENNYTDTGTTMGTAGGTLLTFIININVHDIYKTVLLASVGAVVSFFISLALKESIKYVKNRRKW